MTFLRQLLIMLLVLAVPVQGFSAMTMAACEGDHGLVGAAGSEHHHPGSADAYHATVAVHNHHATLDDDHHAPFAHHHHDGSKCAGCGPCCAMSAIAALPQTTVSTPSATVQRAFSPDHYLGFIPHGLDRPPRTAPV
jgi:hypothetical protein